MPPASPPRPGLAFRVSVAGHRRDKLPADPANDARLVAEITAVLERIARVIEDHRRRTGSLYDDRPTRLTVLTGLAEGTDRLAVTAAARAGWALHAVLPFDATAYRADFAEDVADEPASLARFEAQLDEADFRTILDGIPGRYDAYAPLGRAMVEGADLLIVAWDGKEARGPGGTANIVQMARRSDMPIVRVALRPGTGAWLERERAEDDGRSDGLAGLDARVDALLRPPADAEPIERWFAETGGGRRPPRLYARTLGLLARLGSPRGQEVAAPARPAANAEDPGEARRSDWIAEWSAVAPAVAEGSADRFARQLGWADALAAGFAARFRSTYTAIYILAVLAVLAGGLLHLELPADWDAANTAIALAEPLLLVAMLWQVGKGRRLGLQHRWLDYRSLAERTRHAAILWPLGRAPEYLRVPTGALPSDPRYGWIGWLLRAMLRDAGLVTGRLDGDHAERCRTLVQSTEAGPQQEFHRQRRLRLGPVSEPLEHLAERLVLLALLVAALRLTDVPGILIETFTALDKTTVIVLEHRIWIVLAAVGTALPAMAAAIHGFLGMGDFEGLALRSAEVEGRLAQLRDRLDRIQPADLEGVGEVAIEMTRAMEGELGSWHAAAASRRLQAG